jgi:MbtH protein
MSNPFERADTRFRVLVNGEGQHSLWPETIDVPAGWRVTFGPDTREACLAHVEREWTDLRPASLRGR